LGWQQLAEAHFFARDYTAFRDAAECAIALNPRNSHTRAYLGLLIAFSGEWDRGLAPVQRAMALNPNLRDWCYLPYFYNHYRKGEYQTALQVVKKIVSRLTGKVAHATHKLGPKANSSIQSQRGASKSCRRLEKTLGSYLPVAEGWHKFIESP
jgi:tetratricopeptide (TPR) repeat protein